MAKCQLLLVMVGVVSYSIAKGLSCFSENKLGDYIASPIVSAVDDSTIPGEWGSIDIDDEGNLGSKRLLIKNGKLNDYMIDDLNGRRMERNGNGACRRQNYRFIPTSRMSNTYICNGKSTPEEIITVVLLIQLLVNSTSVVLKLISLEMVKSLNQLKVQP